MMTFLEKIKPHLISNDPLIQEIVLHALHDFPNVPEEWTNVLLKEAFINDDKLSSILIYIENQPINEEAVNILIENIPRMDQSKAHLALNLIDHIEPKLALKYKEQLEKYIHKDMWSFFELIVNGTEEEVYTKYGEILNTLDRAKSHPHDVYLKAKKLAACIVKKGWVTEEEIDLLVEEELKEKWISYNGTLTIYMIGLLGLDKHIALLASLLDRDDDIMLEEVSVALIGFQSDEVVKAVEPYLKKEESIIYASSVVENIKSDLAVQVLSDAYRRARELQDQDLLIEALCHQLSEKALPLISKHMTNEYVSSMVEVEQVVYSYYSILGLDHPELEEWRQAALESEIEYRNASEQGRVVPNIPVQREKVGRNDPCPCGSGKKYKKCCGK
ncbi:SEC-C metal-binding domain-containing protein [Neobacillus sp. FSL H8-0543]|uniref:YecA family protein n=1 Tax=Neobacillus sp. FSL H8-0543 TaxID=2954672 RepID=UPI003157F61B